MRLPAILIVTALVLSNCSSDPKQPPTEQAASEGQAISWGAFPADGPTTVDTPIGIALDIENGSGVPLAVRAGQRVYVNQIDIRAAIDATTDEGVAGLATSGDFQALDWGGVSLADQAVVEQQNADGTWIRRRFYREAEWMDQPSAFLIEQLDAQGNPSGAPLTVDTGLADKRTPIDSFFVRRLRAIQWTYDCATTSDCSSATKFGEEALVELRDANGSHPNVVLGAATTQLRVRWSLRWNTPWTISVQQVQNPKYDYGFQVDLDPVTAPRNDGTYAPGQQITFRVTLRDGAGNRLHAPGQLPTYEQYLEGVDSGIQYYRFFQEPYATYYRRKHREHHLLVGLSGPAQDIQPIHTITDIFADTDFQTNAVVTALPSRDGFFATASEIPSFGTLLGGPPAWTNAVADTVSFNVPSDAKPGTYVAVVKGRRNYLGEELPRAKVLRIQVGSPAVTVAALNTGNCSNCHTGGAALNRINHGIDDRASCSSCHAPLTFELEGPVYVRAHFIHSRSDRFDQPLQRCATCHLSQESIGRTSKSACLSCHKSYPQWHVQKFGPIKDMYVGGGSESFQQCTSSCHTTHPGSGL